MKTNDYLRFGVLVFGVIFIFGIIRMVTTIMEEDAEFWNYTIFGCYLLFSIYIATPWGDWLEDLIVKSRKPSRREMETMNSALEALREQQRTKGMKPLTEYRFRAITDQEINACAYGSKTIAVTSGALKALDSEEMQAVIAHEIGHHVNGDTLYNDLRMGLFLPLVIPLQALNFSILALSMGLLGASIALLLLPLSLIGVFAWFVIMGINLVERFLSRSIEYAADRYATELTGGEALLKFLDYLEALERKPEGGLFSSFLVSHPPTELRRGRVEGMIIWTCNGLVPLCYLLYAA